MQELQEEFDADEEVDVQIAMFNYNPMMYDFEEEVNWETAPYFPEAEAENIPFGFWDSQYAVEYQSYSCHPLEVLIWVTYPNEMDSVLISPTGEVVDRYSMYDYSAGWQTEGVKEFILSNIE